MMSDALSRETVVPPDGPLSTIETCHSTWVFDELDHRFRRLLKGIQLSSQISTDWRPYDHVVLDEGSDAFLVILDASGTRLLRSWRHVGSKCERCGEATTQEMSVAELNREVANRETTLA